ncbi:hypothetical protein ACJJIF_04515 [Microbulbifer sp. SSSA002]|uniref:hypothetical protein n=1 Tax=unclassified Microbulbifer TaxID=2619833 RepID=UPI004039338F
MEIESTSSEGALEPETPAPGPVSGKYSPDNPPKGWTYVNYKNIPGGGFQCPNCNAVEDGADVDGHNC